MDRTTVDHADLRCWPLAVIGGGSAAAMQVRQGDIPPPDVIVVAERWGTGMEFLGDSTLQSYGPELALSLQPSERQALVAPGRLRPTAAEFDRHVRESLMSSGATLKQAKVLEVKRRNDSFLLRVRNPGGSIGYVRAAKVVLATGSTPIRPDTRWGRAGAVAHDTVHREHNQGRYARWTGKSVIVVGAGNSAMQLASLVAADAAEVIVLATRYVGMFPAENPNRFAWRAPSQLAFELVGKSALECDKPHWSTPCVRFLVYDQLEITDTEVSWTCAESSNQNPLGLRSAAGRCRHAVGRPAPRQDIGAWRESRPIGDCAVIWATGSEPVLPDGSLIDALERGPKGIVRVDQFGETSEPGLFALGACAGQPSVNETRPALMRGRRVYLMRTAHGRGPARAEELV